MSEKIAEKENTSSEEAQMQLRAGKAEALRERGIDPYGNGLEVAHTSDDVKRAHDAQSAEELSGERPRYVVAGRVTEMRRMGKIAFLRILDRAGDLQLLVRKDLGPSFELITEGLLDRGDIVRASGQPIRTKTGELSLEADELTVLTKALRPLPEKWHGLSDVETRYRRRYVDLFTTPGVRDVFLKRAKMISSIRRYLDGRGYVEVETPVLHEQAGGAAARPFRTHHNTLDLPLNLRIATELHLKRLVVGGLERVYEIGRIFRNEGIDRSHNPEFTSIEFYEAHSTYLDLIDLTEKMLEQVALDVNGTTRVSFQGQEIDFVGPYPRVSMVGEVGRYYAETLGIAPPETDDASAWLDTLGPHLERMREHLAGRHVVKHEVGLTRAMELLPRTLGEVVAASFETFCEERLDPSRPVFVLDFPLEVSPLARKRNGDDRLVDRFELYVGGMELANAFSELNDPADQRERFQKQVEAARRGDEEAMPYDEDFVRALEHGMPPTAGQGIGIDRLCMVLTDSPSIRDVVLFPLLRPEQKDRSASEEQA